MATAPKVNAGQVTQGSFLFVDPKQIEKGKNSRFFEFTDDQVMELVASYESVDTTGNPQGQLVPIECRIVEPSKRLEVHAGRRRLEAAIRYNELHPDEPMKIKVLVTRCSAEEALVRGIRNNRDVAATSWVDDAFNQKRLREEHGWADTKIAELYNQQPSVVSRLKKLTGLRGKVLKLIHEGVIGLDAGCDLSEVDDISQDEILLKIQQMQDEHEAEEKKRRAELIEEAAAMPQDPPSANGDGDKKEPAKKGPKAPKASAKPAVNGRKKPAETPSQIVKKGVRAAKEAAAKPGEEKKKQPRSLKEVKDFFGGFDGPREDPAVRTFAGLVMEWVEGKITDLRMTKVMNDMICEKKEKEKETK